MISTLHIQANFGGFRLRSGDVLLHLRRTAAPSGAAGVPVAPSRRSPLTAAPGVPALARLDRKPGPQQPAHAGRTLAQRPANADLFLPADAQSLQWRLDAPWMLDVADFERALAQADRAQRAGNASVLRTAGS